MSDVVAGEAPPRCQPGTIIAKLIQLPRPWLIAFDVDGTLAPVTTHPQSARVPKKVVDDLTWLATLDGIDVALLTGRDAMSLAPVVEVPGAYLGLEHGEVVVAPGADPLKAGLPVPNHMQVLLDRFLDWAEKHAAPRGADVVVKRAAVSVYVRAVAVDQPDTAKQVIREALAEARHLGLVSRESFSMMEASVGSHDKVDALDRIVEMTGAQGVLYLGDALSDHQAITRAGVLGVGVHVSSPRSPHGPDGATAIVEGPEAVADIVKLLRNAA